MMKRMHTTPILVWAMTAISCTVPLAHADVLPANIETIEIMMESLAADVHGIVRTFGIDETSPLSFTTMVDPDAKTFSYSLDPGTTYMGTSLTLEGIGGYDGELSRWEGSTTGSSGGRGEWWEATWFFELLNADPFAAHQEWDIGTPLGLDLHGDLDIEWSPGGGFAASTLTATLTLFGAPVGSASVSDRLVRRPDGSVDWYLEGDFNQEPDPQRFALTGAGDFPDGTGLGYAEFNVVPEPSSLGLLALGGLVALRRRRVQHA